MTTTPTAPNTDTVDTNIFPELAPEPIAPVPVIGTIHNFFEPVLAAPVPFDLALAGAVALTRTVDHRHAPQVAALPPVEVDNDVEMAEPMEIDHQHNYGLI